MAYRFSRRWFPPGASASAGAASVETEAGYGDEDVAIAGVEGDPFPVASLAVGQKTARGHLTAHESGFAEDVGDGAGAIVAGVIESGVAAAPFVGLVLEAVSSGDGQFDLCGSTAWGVGPAVVVGGGSFRCSFVGDWIPGLDLTAAGRE